MLDRFISKAQVLWIDADTGDPLPRRMYAFRHVSQDAVE